MDYHLDNFVDYLQAMDYICLVAVPIVAIILYGFALVASKAKKTDPLQPNGSRGSHNSRSHHHQSQPHHRHHYNQQPQHTHNIKHDSSDSGIAALPNGQRHHHQYQHQHQHQSAKQQRKARNSQNKRQDAATTANVGTKQVNTDYPVNEWLQRDMVYCYERQYISSCAEENIMPRHKSTYRNSTSSDVAASDDLNSSSGNEDVGTSYSNISKSSKKSAKARQKRQQKRKPQEARNTCKANAAEQMEVDEECKENGPPNNNSSNANASSAQKQVNSNLRKQCTKAAALKAVNRQFHTSSRMSNNTSNNKKDQGNSLSNSPSYSSVCSTLSSSSDRTSVTSSSASSSPTNSAHCSPSASPTVSKRSTEHYKKLVRGFAPPPQRLPVKQGMSESELAQHLRRYLIEPNLLRIYGYPVESAIHEGCIEIYRCLPKPCASSTHTTTATTSSYINTQDGLKVTYSSTTVEQQWTLGDSSGDSADSGQASGVSSPPSVDSDASETGEDETATTTACYTPDGSYQIFAQYQQSLEKHCMRCKRPFHVTEAGEYLTRESCVFHWGKLHNMFVGKNYKYRYTCCQRDENSEGCTQNSLHVWSGAVLGLNGPYTDFVHTRPRYDYRQRSKVYALDCEMSFTGRGLELTKVTLIGYDGQPVYNYFVRPEAEIVDYNTRFSGITEKDLCPIANTAVKTLAEVQRDLLELIDADTILVGHALDNDLRVLRIVHKTIVDTSITFPDPNGFPYRRSLRYLTRRFLQRDIQNSNAGHSSLEDSRACLDLMLWKVHEDMRY